MDQRRLGELSVSVVGMGCNQLGTSCDEATTARIIGEALDNGVTYFDTADEYGGDYTNHDDHSGWGTSEVYLGRALRSRRDEAVIASKFGIHGPSGGGGSAKWVEQAVEESLRRLGTDRIDMYQLHMPDPTVPVEETLEALRRLIDAGKVREIGCCNFTGAMLEEASSVAADKGLRPFVSVQSPLNLMQRASLGDPLPACEQLDLAFIPYYPLASGMLTGKYRRGAVPSSGTRLTEQVTAEAQARLFSDKTFTRLEALEAYASERGHTLLELAFAWLLGQPQVATVIAGAAKPGQVASNAAAVGWQLTRAEVDEVTGIVSSAA